MCASGATLLSLQGGNAPNAIPRNAAAELLLADEAGLAAAQQALRDRFAALCREYSAVEVKEDEAGRRVAVAPVLDLAAVPAPGGAAPLSAQSSLRLLSLLLAAPHGVERLHPEIRDMVETSVSLSLVSLGQGQGEVPRQGEEALLHFMERSSSGFQGALLEARLRALGALSGCTVVAPFNAFPGWEPKMSSPVTQQVLLAHQELFGRTPRVYSVHAGLECGLIQGRYPALDCVSTGPYIADAHSPDEKLHVPTVEPWYRWLRATIEKLGTTKSLDAVEAPAVVGATPVAHAGEEETKEPLFCACVYEKK